MELGVGGVLRPTGEGGGNCFSGRPPSTFCLPPVVPLYPAKCRPRFDVVLMGIGFG